MPTSTSSNAASSSSASNLAGTSDAPTDPLAGVDHIIVIDNGAHNIRIASIPYPFPASTLSAATTPASSASSSSSAPCIHAELLAQNIVIDVFPNAIARTRTPHMIPATTSSPTAPPPGSKASIFVSSHIHTLLDDYAALHLRLPHQSGIVVDWAAQKTIWDHVLLNHLAKVEARTSMGKKGKLLANKAVIITEPYFNLEHSQHATDLLLFEHYGAHAVWRTSPAALVGWGTNVFNAEPSFLASQHATTAVEEHEVAASKEENLSSPAAEDSSSATSSKRQSRNSRAPSSSTSTGVTDVVVAARIPSLVSSRRPDCMLVLDLGYSYCHAIPIICGTPHYPSIRRLELGGKMLINLFKETLSFQQLDMMDESWLMSHIFAHTSFVAAQVGERIYGGKDKVEKELNRIESKAPAEWSYNELLFMSKFGGGGKNGNRRKIELIWSLPDYGGSASGKGGSEARDRARYGFVLQGPNPPPYPYAGGYNAEEGHEEAPRKRLKVDPYCEWVSSFIASTVQTPLASQSPSSDNDDDEDAEDQQTLRLTSERFSILEHLFNPTSLGLDQKGLPELILDSIGHVSSSYALAADMMWSNIVLTGGLGNAVNIRTRLFNELRPLAPTDVPLRIYTRGADASMLPIQAGVGLACEISARETLRQQREKLEPSGGGVKSARRKGRARQSRGSGVGMEAAQRMQALEREAKWLTYAQWMNPSSTGLGGSVDADLIKAANLTFYPAAHSYSEHSNT